MTGIEPAPSVWKTEALPLSYIQKPRASGYFYFYKDNFEALTGYGFQKIGHAEGTKLKICDIISA